MAPSLNLSDDQRFALMKVSSRTVPSMEEIVCSLLVSTIAFAHVYRIWLQTVRVASSRVVNSRQFMLFQTVVLTSMRKIPAHLTSRRQSAPITRYQDLWTADRRARKRYSRHFLAGPVGITRGSARPLAYWDCGFETRRGHECLSLVSAVCCQVEVSVSGWSLVQRSPAECGVSECDREAP